MQDVSAMAAVFISLFLNLLGLLSVARIVQRF